MIHLHEDALTEPVDVDQLRTSIGRWLEACHDLDITSAGTLAAADGVRRASLSLIAGEHPRPGATYRLVEAHAYEHEGELHHRIDQTDIEVLADQPDLVQLQFRKHGASEVTSVTIEPADRPTTCTIDLQGSIEASIVISLDEVPSGRSPQVEITALHRFAAVEATVAISVDPGIPAGRWRWTFRAEGRGRSIVRPIAALAWIFTRRRVQAEVDRLVDEVLGEGVPALNAILTEQTADGSTPDDGARRTIDAWVEQLPIETPRPPG